MTAITKAEELLTAATVERECGHVSWVWECAECTPIADAQVRVRELGFTPDTLRVAVTLAKALEATEVDWPTGQTDKALAEFEKLFPETQRPANGGVDEAKADRV